jgi:hypothetical protein
MELFKKIKRTTRNLNKATFWICYGGKLVDFDKTDGFVYDLTVEMPLWIFLYEYFGVINYRRFCNKRQNIKDKLKDDRLGVTHQPFKNRV